MTEVPVITPARDSLHGQWDPTLAPCLTVQPGDVVEWRDVLDVSWGRGQHDRENQTREKWGPREAPRDSGPAMHGPVFVEGAHPGGTLAVTIESIEPGPYGWTIGGLGPFNEALVRAAGVPEDQFLLLWDLDADAMTATSEFGLSLALDPFFGTIGICPEGEGPHIGWYPTPQGGNMDCAALTVGSTIYFPVAHEGALFSLGDAHARQGDGEASGSAIEMMVSRARLRFALAELPVTTVTADTPSGWVTCGFDRDLDVATGHALSAMLDLMEHLMGVDRSHAMVLASAVVDLRITQLVNGVRGVHARLHPDALQ